MAVLDYRRLIQGQFPAVHRNMDAFGAGRGGTGKEPGQQTKENGQGQEFKGF